MIEALKIVFVLSIGLSFACCEITSLWWLLPLTCVLLILQWPLSLSLLVAALMLSPIFFRRQREKKRQLQLTRTLPDLIESLANCLRAGMTLEASFKECLNDRQGPVKEIVGNICHALSLGSPLEEVLKQQSALWPQVALLQQLNSAVSLSRQSGMDISQLFDTLAHDARNDLLAQERMLSLSAQGRLQAWVIGLLPFALLALLSVMEPERVHRFLSDARGQFVIGTMVVLEVIGVIWIKRLIRI